MTTNSRNDDLRRFYDMVKGSRERVFHWLESLPDGVFTREHPEFAYGSLRNIHAHVAFCYCVWIGKRGLGTESCEGLSGADLPDVAAMRAAFRRVDDVLETAFKQFTDLDAPLEIVWHGEPLKITRRWLLMHPITHEFHHKGQMLALGRVLGHPYPAGPDTDLLPPFEQP